MIPIQIFQLTAADFDDAISCLDACANDPRESLRYARDYANVANKFRTARRYMGGDQQIIAFLADAQTGEDSQ